MARTYIRNRGTKMDPKIEMIKNNVGKLQSTLSMVAETKPKSAEEAENQIAFLVNQLEALKAEIDNLDKTIVLGAPLTEYGENLAKLSSIEQNIDELEAKLELTIEKIGAIRKDQEMLKSLLQEGISEKQVQALEARIKNIEALQEKLMSSKSTKAMVELVKVVDELNKRVKRIEELFKASNLEEAAAVQRAPQFPQPAVMRPPEPKQGILRRIINFFKRK